VGGGVERPERRVCHAHRKDGEPCRQWAVAGKAVCFYHGAKRDTTYNAGARHYGFRDGGRSRMYRQIHLQERYEALLADPERTRLYAELAHMRVRYREALERFHPESAAELEGLVAELVAGLREEVRSTEPEEERKEARSALTTAARNLAAIFREKAAEDRQLVHLSQEIRHLAEAIHRIEHDEAYLISPVAFETLMARVSVILREELAHDRRALEAIEARVSALVLAKALPPPPLVIDL
jgi:hypothetical protein